MSHKNHCHIRKNEKTGKIEIVREEIEEIDDILTVERKFYELKSVVAGHDAQITFLQTQRDQAMQEMEHMRQLMVEFETLKDNDSDKKNSSNIVDFAAKSW